MTVIDKALSRMHAALLRTAGPRELGDVQGWVMITLMTAGLVAVLWKFAGDALLDMFQRALNSVTG